MAIIKSIEQLRKYVKINASKDFTTYEPFLEDAQQKYIEPYFGASLLDRLDGIAEDPLTVQICRALGPFSLALATHEFSINYGESGHTVTRTDKLTPASDAKIEKATQSLFERGWANLDRAISYVRRNRSSYEEWVVTDFAKKLSTILFSDAVDFQENGMIQINYSSLTFYYLRLLIMRIEKSETFMFVPETRRSEFISDVSSIPDPALSAMKAYTASRVAALHTSAVTRVQRGKPKSITEFRPLIRPLYENEDESLNYFNAQAEFWKDALIDALVSEGIIDTDSRAVKWNDKDKKVFVATAKTL